MARRYDVVMVGAGLGGITCAALLAKWGLKVIVIEKNNRLGGKQVGISARGFKGEMWPTFGIPMEVGPFPDAFRQLGIESKLDIIPGSTALMYRRPDGKWVTTVQKAGPQGPDATENMFKAWQLKPKESEVALKVLAEMVLVTPEQMDALDNISARQWVEQHGEMPQALRGFIAAQSNMLATGLYELVAMSELAGIMQIFGGSTPGYPRGGYARLVEDIGRVLKANGGEIRARARVQQITARKGRVSGVVAGDAFYEAPLVVSNTGIQPTVLKLVGEHKFDKGYVKHVKDIVPSTVLQGIRPDNHYQDQLQRAEVRAAEEPPGYRLQVGVLDGGIGKAADC